MSQLSNQNLQNPTIALVEWNWLGHHPGYAVQFALAASKAGLNVAPFCCNPADFEQRLQDLAPADDSLKGCIYKASQIHWAYPQSGIPPRLRPIHQAIHHFGFLGKQLRRWSRKQKVMIDKVFFCSIYDREFQYFRFAEPFFRFPWSGLYFNSAFFRIPAEFRGDRYACPEKIFTLSSCSGVAVLDPSAIQPMQTILGTDTKKVVLFPDFTDFKPSPMMQGNEPDARLAAKIREFAKGRKIISLVGYLQRSKGIQDFTAAAQDPELRDAFFFLGGEINWRGISDNERFRLIQRWEQCDNFYAHLHRLSTEATLNAVIAESDVIYAAYVDFPNSSNVITKAALMHKPLLVNDGYLMAENVRKYGLGEVALSGNVEDQCNKLKLMLSPGYREILEAKARWMEYTERNSADLLPTVMRDLLL